MQIRYFETLKESLKQYSLAKEKADVTYNANFTLIQKKLFDSNLFLELYIMQFRFIKGTYRHLVETLIQEGFDDY